MWGEKGKGKAWDGALPLPFWSGIYFPDVNWCFCGLKKDFTNFLNTPFSYNMNLIFSSKPTFQCNAEKCS